MGYSINLSKTKSAIPAKKLKTKPRSKRKLKLKFNSDLHDTSVGFSRLTSIHGLTYSFHVTWREGMISSAKGLVISYTALDTDLNHYISYKVAPSRRIYDVFEN